MKTKSAILASIATLMLAVNSNASVTVDFNNPQDFDDTAISEISNDNNVKSSVSIIEDYVTTKLETALPDSQNLLVTIDNVDPAASTGGLKEDALIASKMYPSRLSFKYKVYDEGGELIYSGTKNLMSGIDPSSFQVGSELHPSNLDLLNNWASKQKDTAQDIIITNSPTA